MSHHLTSQHEHQTAIRPLPTQPTPTADTGTVPPQAPSAAAAAPRDAGGSCSYCGDPLADSRYRDGDLRLCRPCGVVARMSGKQRTDQLRKHLTGDLLRRVALLPTDAAQRNLEAAFARQPYADIAAVF